MNSEDEFEGYYDYMRYSLIDYANFMFEEGRDNREYNDISNKILEILVYLRMKRKF